MNDKIAMKTSTGRHRSMGSIVLMPAAVVTCALIFQAYACNNALSAEIIIAPSCGIREEYNDNIFLTTGSKKSDFITTVAPSLGVVRNTERLKSSFLSSLGWYSYARNEDLGSVDYSFQGQADYRLSPRDTLGLNAAYSHSSRPDNINQMTGLATNRGSDVSNYSINAGRILTATSSASANYSYQRQAYDNTQLQESTAHNAGLGFTKDLDAIAPLLKGNITTSYSRVIYRDSSNDNYSLSIGASRNINEKFTWSLSAGGRYTHSDFLALDRTSLSLVPESKGNWGWVGSASLGYTGEKSRGSLSVSRNFSNGSGQVGATENTVVALALSQTVTRKLTLQLSASYNRYKSEKNQFASSGTDETVYQVNTGVLYKLSDYFDLGFQYAYYTDTYGISGAHADQNKFMITLTTHGRFRLIGTNTLVNEVFHGTR